MSDVDVAPVRHLGLSDVGVDAVSPSHPGSIQYSRTKRFLGDAAMERERSRDSRDGSRGQGGAQQNRRGSAFGAQLRLPSSSPGSRVPRPHRGREKKYHGSEAYQEDSERRLDERRHSQSPDRRERYLDDTRRGRNSLVRDPYHDSGKRHGSPSPKHHSRSNDYSEHPRDRSFSPSSRKRPRSRSPLPFPSSRSKRSKRDRDRRRRTEKEERFERDHQKPHGPTRFDHGHSSSRKRSMSPHFDAPHHRHADRGDHPNESRPRHRSRSPHWEANADDRPVKPLHRSHVDSKNRNRSVSRPGSRRSSFSYTHSPSRSIGRLPPRGPSDVGPHSRPSPVFEPPRDGYPPGSPKDRGSRRPRKRTKNRDEPKFFSGAPLASGANSIEVSFKRTDRRNSFEASVHFDSIAPGELSPHANPSSLHYGTPSSPRPHLTAGSSEGDDRQHSPRGQHLSRDRNVLNHPGHARRRSGSQSPPSSPSEPMSKDAFQGRGFSRGGFRGGMTFGHGSHNNSISSRHGQWAATAAGVNRGTSNTLDYSMSARPDTQSVKDEDRDAEHGPKPLRDNQVKDATKNERVTTDQMPPPRPPPTAPTGPSSKFSFAFKTSNKNPVATPKPEISQKFSAAPRNERQPIIDDRDRDLPKDTPREPASARARAEYHNRRAPQQDQPRTRKVLKTRRKLKPKPPLDPELAQSTSVYFRKPGNESVIGSGTYGKVFRGKHVYTKKLVALKRIRMEGERDGFPVTAMREVKLLQSLRHQNIVDLHEVMIEKNECYMVFEYLSHDLTGLLNHPTYKLDAAQKKHLTMQLFQGLDYLHKRGVLHRDIKAANILVSSDGILKLADFGLARFYAKREQQNYTNRVITIWYRPPELLLGETQYGAAVDIWSAACVMVEIFTRRAIFPGDGGEISQLDKIYDILGTPNQEQWPGFIHTPWFELIPRGHRRPNVFADKYRERVPAAAFDLLVQMFQYDPIKRPSAADVLEHPYFTIEQPPPQQAVELRNIKGDWHEFESKALRREKEKQEKQQRDARRAAAASKDEGRDREKKRPPSPHETRTESKRLHIDGQAPIINQEADSNVIPLSRNAMETK